MAAYPVRRILALMPVMVAVVTIVFLLIHLAKGRVITRCSRACVLNRNLVFFATSRRTGPP